jgi:hypothetical protein
LILRVASMNTLSLCRLPFWFSSITASQLGLQLWLIQRAMLPPVLASTT